MDLNVDLGLDLDLDLDLDFLHTAEAHVQGQVQVEVQGYVRLMGRRQDRRKWNEPRADQRRVCEERSGSGPAFGSAAASPPTCV